MTVGPGERREQQLRVGIVGAGRSRNGSGPYVAQAFEKSGCILTAVAGRDAARATANAEALGAMLGHPVVACEDAAALCDSGIDILAIASPTETHSAVLRIAAAAGVACLCEKPLADIGDVEHALESLGRFAATGALVAEMAQWPLLLPVLEALHGPSDGSTPRALSMGLSPIDADPRTMAKESLPHLISMAWSIGSKSGAAPLGLESSRLVTARSGEAEIFVRFRSADGPLEATLFLRQCVDQPRPAWFAVDGRRADRRIGVGYSMSFAAGEREIPVQDPLHAFVEAFVRECREPASAARGERRSRMARAAAARLVLWRAILTQLFG